MVGKRLRRITTGSSQIDLDAGDDLAQAGSSAGGRAPDLHTVDACDILRSRQQGDGRRSATACVSCGKIPAPALPGSR